MDRAEQGLCYLNIKQLTKTDLTKIVRETGKAGTPTLTRGPTRGRTHTRTGAPTLRTHSERTRA